jgi:hypothetical protein
MNKKELKKGIKIFKKIEKENADSALLMFKEFHTQLMK